MALCLIKLRFCIQIFPIPGCQIIDYANAMAALDVGINDVGTDKASSARNDDFHGILKFYLELAIFAEAGRVDPGESDRFRAIHFARRCLAPREGVLGHVWEPLPLPPGLYVEDV